MLRSTHIVHPVERFRFFSSFVSFLSDTNSWTKFKSHSDRTHTHKNDKFIINRSARKIKSTQMESVNTVPCLFCCLFLRPWKPIESEKTYDNYMGRWRCATARGKRGETPQNWLFTFSPMKMVAPKIAVGSRTLFAKQRKEASNKYIVERSFIALCRSKDGWPLVCDVLCCRCAALESVAHWHNGHRNTYFTRPSHACMHAVVGFSSFALPFASICILHIAFGGDDGEKRRCISLNGIQCVHSVWESSLCGIFFPSSWAALLVFHVFIRVFGLCFICKRC